MMCEKTIPAAMLLDHVPICYRELCKKWGIEPLCTCNSCEGKKAHPTASELTIIPKLEDPAPQETKKRKLKEEKVKQEAKEKEKARGGDRERSESNPYRTFK
jgi:hypothetical protein